MNNRSQTYVGQNESTLAVNKVLRNTYTLLAMTLAFSAVVATISTMMNLPYPGLIITLVAYFGLLFGIHKTKDSGMGIVLTFALTGFLGYTLGPILNMALSMPGGGEMVATALGGTALTFFATSAYVLTTKKDMSKLGGLVTAGIIMVFVAIIANLFFQLPALQLAISAIMIPLMAMLIMWQTSDIINGGERNYILATVTLYVSIYNLFLSMLQLLMAFGGDE
ncbi:MULTISPECIES: Bax inhibitor-1/YccA family protein [Idiomarina]|jgi:modulator of FtsH protease|uniref:Bax inhibitor-1/YccA family protein n=2 Tax=Idiomarina abyssalis TaxID=86102 RepID=A0A8I1KJL3_9GAMM|nr:MULTISPECIES: Bax inhibitor-1/YccA family protein [Idiomarina]KPD22680.1 membrane protein [Idiomarina abyssalis]MAB22485.1 BAX inhibitor (BI)-1/YccA family protein [Idiomarina sp.]MAO68177.1 BAX inhibitor (BI)-1/YccA family protein [Idiomarina sp.]MBF79929.1 BAX inhibitor (BI)-1/YccA family protein [Idiomarina sp.]MBH95354.1 BAX inhibitor (BI)-1/YccA family protein [Idiomarina sp.]|tara:strand:+ start:268 stop:936 length:669 start_codon:yes stop_codon:yes gene_type:complete